MIFFPLGDGSQLNVSLSRDDNGVSIECAATNSIGTTKGSMSLAVKCKEWGGGIRGAGEGRGGVHGISIECAATNSVGTTKGSMSLAVKCKEWGGGIRGGRGGEGRGAWYKH